MSITNGDKKLICTFTMLVDSRFETTIEIQDKEINGEILNLKFNFENNDSENEKFKIRWETIDAHTMRVILVNWISEFPIALKDFQLIGDIDQKELFIIFSSTTIGSGNIREIIFSAYTGKDIPNG